MLTNVALVNRAGSELVLFDVARKLRELGHTPIAYSARLGRLAEEIRRRAIPVIDDLACLAEPPDLIHSQHHLPTIAALAAFPGAPAV